MPEDTTLPPHIRVGEFVTHVELPGVFLVKAEFDFGKMFRIEQGSDSYLVHRNKIHKMVPNLERRLFIQKGAAKARRRKK